MRPRSEFYKDGKYELAGEGKTLDAAGHDQVPTRPWWLQAYPIFSIEDGLAEDDWDGWKVLTEALGKQDPAGRRRQLYVTNPEAAGIDGISKGIANSILIKVNQIGSLSETLESRRDGPQGGLHQRSSRTARARPRTATIADISVATNAGQIKTGSLSRSDRIAKYNQLIRIEEELGPQAVYARGEHPALKGT